MSNSITYAPKHAASCPHGSLWRVLLVRIGVVAGLATVAITLALIDSWLWFPTIPREVRSALASASTQIESPSINTQQHGLLHQQLERLVDAAKCGSLAPAQCNAAIQAVYLVLAEHNMGEGLMDNYIRPSTLDSEEKLAAALTLRRYTAAFCRGKVDEETAVAVESIAMDVDNDGNTSLKEELSAHELRSLVTAMSEVANAADIEEDLPPVDVCAEVREIVDRSLRVE